MMRRISFIIMLNAIMLSVVMLNIVMLSVVAPLFLKNLVEILSNFLSTFLRFSYDQNVLNQLLAAKVNLSLTCDDIKKIYVHLINCLPCLLLI